MFSDCFMLASKGQALVQFERIEDAEHVLLLQKQRQCISISNCFPQISYSHVESLSTEERADAPSTDATGATDYTPSS